MKKILLIINVMFWLTAIKAQSTSTFSKKVTVYTKSSSLSCPHLGLNLKENLSKRSREINSIVYDNFTHAKMSFLIVDKKFYNKDSVLMLFVKSGFPATEIEKIEIDGLSTIKAN